MFRILLVPKADRVLAKDKAPLPEILCAISRRFPHRGQHPQRFRPVAQRAPSRGPRPAGPLARTCPVQKPNCILPVIPAVQTEFVQNGLARFAVAPP
jgi:hypothetical protein